MELPDEPNGWRRLQEMAQREKDPRVLVSIIDKMNRLLDQHERSAAEDTQHSVSHGRSSDPAVRLEVHTWQFAE
jgi:hypothetical protein